MWETQLKKLGKYTWLFESQRCERYYAVGFLHRVKIAREVKPCDWAGGGIISTPADLMRFHRALHADKLVTHAHLRQMMNCTHKFRSGLWYGMGMMEVHFNEFFFLLGGLPRMSGHIGVLSTHLFALPQQDVHVVINLGDTGQMTTSFKLLIEIMNLMRK